MRDVPVLVERCSAPSVDVVEKVFKELSLERELKRAERVVVKLNLCGFRSWETGATSDPRFVRAVVEYIRRAAPDKPVYLAEADATNARASLLFKWLGFEKLAEEAGVSVLNLSKGESVEVDVGYGPYGRLRVSKALLDGSFIVNLAKLKTHIITYITCSLKNVFGALYHWRKIDYHRRLDEAIVAANLAVRCGVHIVDGIIAHEGEKGPLYGRPVKLGVVVAGVEPASVDAVCARIAGFKPGRIRHIRLASEAGLGQLSPSVLGDAPRGGLEFSTLNQVAFKFAQEVRSLFSSRR